MFVQSAIWFLTAHYSILDGCPPLPRQEVYDMRFTCPNCEAVSTCLQVSQNFNVILL